jgi:hypothetical protein
MSMFDDAPYFRETRSEPDNSRGIDYDYYFRRARQERSVTALLAVIGLFRRVEARGTKNVPLGPATGPAR